MKRARFAALPLVLGMALWVCVRSSLAADAGVAATPEAVRPLQPGASVPAVTVRSVRGERVGLVDLVRDHGALLVFYRGGW